MKRTKTVKRQSPMTIMLERIRLKEQQRERERFEEAIRDGIAQGLIVELPNGNIALTAKGMELADAQAELRRSTIQ